MDWQLVASYFTVKSTDIFTVYFICLLLISANVADGVQSPAGDPDSFNAMKNLQATGEKAGKIFLALKDNNEPQT